MLGGLFQSLPVKGMGTKSTGKLFRYLLSSQRWDESEESFSSGRGEAGCRS